MFKNYKRIVTKFHRVISKLLHLIDFKLSWEDHGPRLIADTKFSRKKFLPKMRVKKVHVNVEGKRPPLFFSVHVCVCVGGSKPEVSIDNSVVF